METKIIQMAGSIPALLKNSHLNVSLKGWPAAITAIAICGSCVAIYAIKVNHPEPSFATKASNETNQAS